MSPSFPEHFDMNQAQNYLNFAIQFTPQYGDSFLELLRLCLITGDREKLVTAKQQCIHAEPNYGVMWFFYKRSVLDNAIDIWNYAEEAISKEIEENREVYNAAIKKCKAKSKPLGEFWLGSMSLISILRKGMKGCQKREKVKLVYGFEQIMPQIAYL